MKLEHIYTISEITKEIKKIIENNFTNIWIRGEVSNLHLHNSGHIYFSLKDQESHIRVVIFKGKASQLKFKLQNGLNIVVYGYISVYEPRGEYQVIVDYAETTGMGILYEVFEKLKKNLEKKGLFDTKHKKLLPMLPQKIGIITSPTGAAIKDILSVINRRFANIEVLIVPVKVQGEGSIAEIIHAIKILNRIKEIEVIIIARGGGSIEDLWSFNEEKIAYAIYQSHIPIISAIGHETDFTIADFVADIRAATPSIAAEILTKNKEDLRQKINSLRTFIISKTKSTISKQLFNYQKYQNSTFFKRPYYKVDKDSQYIDNCLNVICSRFSQRIEVRKNRLIRCQEYNTFKSPQKYFLEFYRESLKQKNKLIKNAFYSKLQKLKFQTQLFIEKIDSYSPLKTLSRGYSIAYLHPENIIIKDASQASINKNIKVKLSKGEILAKIYNTKK
ncbi:MAG: exodeoxyribonuclease VII large subunit [bacterium]|nr:exodeoxyribonuclease VII large subunit [bacterium]